jgi:hypothetical protein
LQNENGRGHGGHAIFTVPKTNISVLAKMCTVVL